MQKLMMTISKQLKRLVARVRISFLQIRKTKLLSGNRQSFLHDGMVREYTLCLVSIQVTCGRDLFLRMKIPMPFLRTQDFYKVPIKDQLILHIPILFPAIISMPGEWLYRGS